jgi:hypothetical protein
VVASRMCLIGDGFQRTRLRAVILAPCVAERGLQVQSLEIISIGLSLLSTPFWGA